MKKTSLGLIFLLSVFVVPPRILTADSISLTQSFSTLEIIDSYTFTFDLSSVQAVATSLTGGTLSLTHNGNSNNSGELWLATSGGALPIGTLSSSTAGNNFVTDSWALSASVLSEITAQNPWSLTVHLDDNTTGVDKIILGQAGLEIDFTAKPLSETTSAVPEPGTALLIASGIIAIALRRRLKS